jgi:signal transduction histidine kinase
VKAIVEGHGGRILVSTQVNTGSTFAIFLPKKGAVVAG